MSELQWVVDAYTLVFAGPLLAGALGDRFGRRRMLLLRGRPNAPLHWGKGWGRPAMWGFAASRKLRGMPPVESVIVVDVVVSARQSGGAYTLLDVRAAGDVAFDPHVVRQEDLLLYVLAGDLVVVLDGRRYAVAAGDFLALPRRVPRTVRFSAGTRALCLVRPAGIERLASLAADPAVTADDRLALLAAADVQMLPRSLWRVDGAA